MYFDDLGATRSHKAPAASGGGTTVSIHPVVKVNVAAVKAAAAAEAELAATKTRIKLFVVLGVLAAGGGAWLYFKKRKKTP